METAVTINATRAPKTAHLENEDVELLWQAIARAEALLEEVPASQSPTRQFRALLGYLHDVVLARVSEEEREILPALRDAGFTARSDADRLERDHLLMRDDVDSLAAAAAPHGSQGGDQLAAIIRRLIVRLDMHLRVEAAALAKLPGGYQPCTAAWTSAAHWYPLTEGPRIDLDQLAPEHADDAVLNRLTHLRPGEYIELASRVSHPHLLSRLRRRAPHDYSWSESCDDEGSWLVGIKRRHPSTT
jgi:uncharacterized protein (DUF2249 family)